MVKQVTSVSGVDVVLDGTYAYVLTNSGIDIVSLDTEVNYAYAYLNNGSCISSTANALYIGTTPSGVYKWDLSTLSGGDNTSSLERKFYVGSTASLTSDIVRDVHARGDDLLVSTTSGVDYIYEESSTTSFYTTLGSNCCFVGENRSIYYTVGDRYLDICYDPPNYDWVGADYSFNRDSSNAYILPEINDIYVRDNSSAYGRSTVYLATSAGVYVIGLEDPGSESSSDLDSYVTASGIQSITADSSYIYAGINDVGIAVLTLSGTLDRVINLSPDQYGGGNLNSLQVAAIDKIWRS